MTNRQSPHDIVSRTLSVCDRHAMRLRWVMTETESLFPLTGVQFDNLAPEVVAFLDQFSTRFGKLQDAMGAKLFPQLLELVKEQGSLNTFIDKLNRLEKIGVIESAEQWLMLRELRNAFAHDYPEDSEVNAATLNRAMPLAEQLLETYEGVKVFALKYGAY
ncbi:TM1812 family CRISPR-associated protein [uncultured Endozoicomonas sp.]|uniref:TM1812 family CRISPR-associated protein n=1 Tax=uncultured Endozoicomonas sp. TaxID=432652 RepID=UPI002612562B|nr:TM1812 family CRISPR-associated protein [uncultured Endozoicomonas sp.]